MTTVYNTVLHMWKLIRVNPKWSHHKTNNKKQFCIYIWWQMLSRLTAIIILQYIQGLKHCFTPETTVICCINYTSIRNYFCIKLKEINHKINDLVTKAIILHWSSKGTEITYILRFWIRMCVRIFWGSKM